MEFTFTEDMKEDLIRIIEAASTGNTDLSNRDAAMLFHWIRHINEPEYAWVPDKYKVNMPQYIGGQS
jgi:hypothetical protein